MDADKIKFGFISRGIFQGLCALGVLVAFCFPEILVHYLVLIVFLGFGLKPLIEKSKLHAILEAFGERIEERRYKSITAKRRKEISLEQHNEKYRRKRTKDPRLPKNW